MKEPKWVLRSVVDASHDAQLNEHGGASGVRDSGLLESALDRPKNQFSYGEVDICALAAAYAFGIARNHPFVDGNKRTAFMVAYVFLSINGLKLATDEINATKSMLALSSGNMSESDFAGWLRANSD